MQLSLGTTTLGGDIGVETGDQEFNANPFTGPLVFTYRTWVIKI